MEKRTILAITLCIVVWLVWQAFFIKPVEPPPGTIPDGGTGKDTAANENKPASSSSGNIPDAIDTEPQKPEKTVWLETDYYKVLLTNHGAAIKDLYIKKYWARDEKKGGAIDKTKLQDLVDVGDEKHLPATISFKKFGGMENAPVPTGWTLVNSDASSAVFRTNFGGAEIEKKFRLTETPYLFEVIARVTNNGDETLNEQMKVSLFGKLKPKPKTGCFGAPAAITTAACLEGETLEQVGKNKGDFRELQPEVRWTGINQQYFLLALVPTDVEEAACRVEVTDDDYLRSDVLVTERVIPPGGEVEHRFLVYAGPKKLENLKAVSGGAGKKGSAKLDKSVNFGIFAVLCYPMLWTLRLFYGWVGNYGIAIIFLTILVKLLLLPLTQRSMRSMRELAKLKPMMEELKKKYGDDKQKLNEEMLNLYRTHKVNPMGGCFPMLLQMPIWFALYRMLYSSVELYQAPFIAGWIDDLSFRDPYFIMPIVLGATMFLQQRLTPTAADTQQAKIMMYAMPVFFTFIMLYLPSGLVLYIFVNSLLSIGHQMLYNRMTGVAGGNNGKVASK
ncbi:MAG: membrane protein insertase YidC [Deltaproteobacteria bacterium]|nr:MAG: membrane protein insertase YidC [Deltaproteobacteria bacterium]